LIANKVNLAFFQQPELAFKMWLASNKRILSFYQSHLQSSVLFSQEGFVTRDRKDNRLGNTLGLPESAFLASTFKESLMSSSVPSELLNSVSDELISECNAVWEELQGHSALPCAALPMVSKPKQAPVYSFTSLPPKSRQVLYHGFRAFRLRDLNWQETLGFLVRIPAIRVTNTLLSEVMKKSFATCDDYDSLAKISHRLGLYFYTKLSKFRAMHAEAGHWNVKEWTLYTNSNTTWHILSDETLLQKNPFSLRPKEEFDEQKYNTTCVEVLSDDVIKLISKISELETGEAEACLINILLFRAIDNANEFLQIHSVAKQFELFSIAEFCLVKALRYEYSAANLLELGSVFEAQALPVKALQCYELALGLSPQLEDTEEQVARLRAFFEKAAPQNTAIDQANVKKTVPAKTDPQRFFEAHRLPYISDYSKIVDITSIDPELGEELDRKNRVAAFVMRNNKQWLAEGAQHLPPNAQPLLSHYVYKQWLSIFSQPIVDYCLNKPNAFVGQTLCNRNLARHSASGLPVVIDVTNIEALQMILFMISEFEEKTKMLCDLYFISTLAQEQSLRSLCHEHSINAKEMWFYPASMPLAKRWLNSFNGHVFQLDLAVYLNTDTVASNRTITMDLLSLWSFFSDIDSARKAQCLFNNDDKLGLIVPAYHPNILTEQYILELEKKFNALKVKSHIDSKNDLYLDPVCNMFMFRPSAFRAVLEKFGFEAYGRLFFTAIPMLLKELGYRSLSTNEL
jgi:hypothetical protein